jgi:hypothetical protein
MSESLGGTLTGTVTQFDAFIGLGEITDIDHKVWPFHCVSIADGTRTIEVGASVSFQTAYNVARMEAVGITAL